MSRLHDRKKKAEAGPGIFERLFGESKKQPEPSKNDPTKGKGCKSRQAQMRKGMLNLVKKKKQGDLRVQ